MAVCGDGGRYVLKSSHGVGDNVQPQYFCAMTDILHSFC
jgi:hypothetical protein